MIRLRGLTLSLILMTTAAGAKPPAVYRGPYGKLPKPGESARRTAEQDLAWGTWWLYNRDAVLHRIGRARRDPAARIGLAKRLLPVLRRFAADDAQPVEVRAAAAIAVGKARSDTAPVLLALARPPHPAALREAAVLALGLRGRPEPAISELLAEILDNAVAPERLRATTVSGWTASSARPSRARPHRDASS